MQDSRYKWIALSNTSLGVFMAALNTNCFNFAAGCI